MKNKLDYKKLYGVFKILPIIEGATIALAGLVMAIWEACDSVAFGDEYAFAWCKVQ